MREVRLTGAEGAPPLKNRPMIGKAPVRRYNISLPPEIAEALRKIGKGNLSEGIRIALGAIKRQA